MEKKKILQGIVGIIVIVTIVVVLIFLLRGKEIPEKVIEKPLNEDVNISQIFEKLSEMEGLKEDFGDVSNPENNEQFSGENKQLDETILDFGKYNGLEKKAIIKTTDESVNEVWLVKLGSYDQQEEVCRILGNRLQKLRNGFEENESQKEILKRAIIKQEGAVVIMIASPDVLEIEKNISELMK